MKVFVASFNRATDSALEKLIGELKKRSMYSIDSDEADIILAVADRTETFDFVCECFKDNKRIVHLWAGEISCFATHDDVWRHSMTLMSEMQLCTNDSAKQRVDKLCNSIDKKPNSYVVGNVYIDGINVNDTYVDYIGLKKYEYDVVLYNPITRYEKSDVDGELKQIVSLIKGNKYIWIEANGDKYTESVNLLANTPTIRRPDFLCLLKYCKRFITNSSCQYFEAPFIMDKDRIVSIGKRNIERESKRTDMSIKNATANIITCLEKLK